MTRHGRLRIIAHSIMLCCLCDVNGRCKCICLSVRQTEQIKHKIRNSVSISQDCGCGGLFPVYNDAMVLGLTLNSFANLPEYNSSNKTEFVALHPTDVLGLDQY